jgi:hypothetical protein
MRFASADCATVGFVAVEAFVGVDDEGLLWLLPPQETTNIPAAATAIAADSCRMVGCLPA